ncbi:MAG: adenylosuccinate synthase, partial [Candidatus Thermoplasmatota archaeon]|nr:adenylosuccinate synthase [Candidatus Thermoplasmatota archaeon]
GGNNAGHTVLIGQSKYTLHLVPSGILRRGKTCVIGNGVVVDPIGLVKEIDGLKKLGVPVDRNLIVSETAHLVLPYHRELDAHREHLKGRDKIGTTKRGIGPAYGDKAARTGLRMVDLIHPERFAERLRNKIRENNEILKAIGARPLSFKKVHDTYREAGDQLRPLVRNTVVYLHEATQRGADILFEGAQGTFLDIDHGTYPFVTSSNTTAGGACTGSGIPPHRMDRVVGVMKAYTTRVGEGPLPTEDDGVSQMLHGMGREFGATTGRARRCGWFDAVATRHAAIVNGFDGLAVTNVDGLDNLEVIRVCVGYKIGKQRFDYLPADIDLLAQCQPIYVDYPGWQEPTTGARAWKDLPRRARAYLKAITELTGARLDIVSVGPARAQTICL